MERCQGAKLLQNQLSRSIQHSGNNTLLEARGINRSSPGGRQLLRDVSLRVGAGDRVAVTGPTGAGKTLLLRALAVLDPLDSGAVIWRGEPIIDRSVPGFRSSVIYLQQRPTLIEGTVEENLRMPFELKMHRHRPYPREWICERLAHLERNEQFLSQDVVHLSGGERQIVAVIRALALAPVMLLLDEPTAALDAVSVAQIQMTIQHWLDGSSERACVWVTHNAEQAARIGNRRLQMNAGLLTESPQR